MQSSQDHHSIHPALASFADECCATLARLIVYVGALALFAIAGLHFWNQLQLDASASPADQPSFFAGHPLAPGLCRQLVRSC